MRGRARRTRGAGARPMTRERAWEYLLNVLARQAYTVAELRAKLARRGVEEVMGEELLARLVELKIVDDAQYAEQYVEGRRQTHGRLALRRDLARRGVAEEVLAPPLRALDASQQASAAADLLRKNAWRYRPAVPEEDSGGDERARFELLRKAEAKARAFLARRGFDPDAVESAVGTVGWFDD